MTTGIEKLFRVTVLTISRDADLHQRRKKSEQKIQKIQPVPSWYKNILYPRTYVEERQRYSNKTRKPIILRSDVQTANDLSS